MSKKNKKVKAKVNPTTEGVSEANSTPSNGGKTKKAPKAEVEASTASYEEIIEKRDATKAELAEARKGLQDYLKENKLKKNKDYSKDKTHGEAYSSAKKAIGDLEDSLKELNNQAKAARPSTPRNTKYEYPEDVVTSLDKKKYRAKMRAQAKRDEKAANKAESGEEAPKKEKKSKKKEAAPVEEAVVSTKKEKKSKKKAKVADED